MTRKLTIQAMRRRAKARGGRCLSDIYVSDCSKLLWQCAEGHQWMTTPAHIRQGHWCPECARPRPTIDDMQHLAAARGGKCLSDIYINSQSKLRWQCAKGHQWMAKPSMVKLGQWCPHCHGRVRLTIQQMRRLAETRGGKCLSDVYVNAHTKLLWQCARGHQWMATPCNVRNGSWCPACAR